jgi:monovalent cation:H+ antiporter-2, CPA2 family
MAITPAVSGLTPWIYRRLTASTATEPPQTINMPSGGLRDHVVVCGAGRVGRTITDALARLTLPCVLIEIDDTRVQHARAAGLAVIYGDATQTIVLDAAAVTTARAIMITIPVLSDARQIVTALRQMRVAAPIVGRAEGRDEVAALYELGVDEVASPQYEAAIEMTRQALAHLQVPNEEILNVAKAIRRERYGPRSGT